MLTKEELEQIKAIVSAVFEDAPTKENLHALESRMDKRLSGISSSVRLWTTALEGQIGTRITGLEARLDERLRDLETKVGAVEIKVDALEDKVDRVETELKQAIAKSQESTI